MDLRILSWNVRGANDEEKRVMIEDLIKSQKADLVCLQETKIEEMSNSLVRSLGGGRWLCWKAMNSRGATRGVLIFCDSRVLDAVEGSFTVTCCFRSCEDRFIWCFCRGL